MTQLSKSIGRIKSAPVRYRYLLLFATLFGGSLLILTFNNHTDVLLFNSLRFNVRRHGLISSGQDDYTIKTEGCTIPGIKPYNDVIDKYVNRTASPKPCDLLEFSLLENNKTHIWINNKMLKYYDIPTDVNITCCYKPFFRPTAIADIMADDVDDRVEYDTCIDFDNHIEVSDEFVKVSCSYDYFKSFYEQYFLFAVKKPINPFRKNSSEILRNRQKSSDYNVIVMGIDSISRLNFYRTMPKTLKYLKEKGAVELLGYNKVGDNTFPNLTPMLLGIKETELKRTCWPNIKSSFDNCPFIWQWFKEAGYYTALAEDSAALGTFNFLKVGFTKSPTDYYLHTFIHEAEHHVGNNKDLNSYLCMGKTYFYQVLLDYIESLTTTLKSSKLFGFFWEVSMSHDYLNYPTAMDSSYEQFLKRLDSSKYLDNTVLILLSDHGMRWGNLMYTKQGRLEERLPFVYILLPASFKNNFSLAYHNINLNSKRLTTPYDIHATMMDLINLDSIKNERIESRSKVNYAQDRSISLFMTIPENRTCKTAGIDSHWCTCHRNSKLWTDIQKSRVVAEQLVVHLNNLLKAHHECEKLSLKDVVEVTEILDDVDETGWKEFVVVVRTEPGLALFEATLRYNKSIGWSVVGTISRLNVYGNQSRCSKDYQLKMYCYCDESYN